MKSNSTEIYKTEYDSIGVLHGHNLDVCLLDYWHECQMFRRTNAIDLDIFEGCMAVNLKQQDLSYALRRKISRFTGIKMQE